MPYVCSVNFTQTNEDSFLCFSYSATLLGTRRKGIRWWSAACKGSGHLSRSCPAMYRGLSCFFFIVVAYMHQPQSREVHSQKQLAHWAVDVTAQVVPCWLGSWLNCNPWPVLGQWNQLVFQLIQLDITGVHCPNATDSGDIQLSEQKITWVSCIWTSESSLHLISPLNWISTESWLR